MKGYKWAKILYLRQNLSFFSKHLLLIDFIMVFQHMLLFCFFPSNGLTSMIFTQSVSILILLLVNFKFVLYFRFYVQTRLNVNFSYFKTLNKKLVYSFCFFVLLEWGKTVHLAYKVGLIHFTAVILPTKMIRFSIFFFANIKNLSIPNF